MIHTYIYTYIYIYIYIYKYMYIYIYIYINILCQPHGLKSMLERLAAAPKQSFPEKRTPKVGALVIVKTGGVVQQWRVSNIKIATGILVTIKFENSAITVDKSWFVDDANSGSLFLQRHGFFGDMALKRTTNSY